MHGLRKDQPGRVSAAQPFPYPNSATMSFRLWGSKELI
ncbi:hypothetical protein THTE_2181 [Thermogutta terrifontis]|uniref:Uncharacterized protein n=1 Tax=Thermogutta terrifontis TaxID=1331910 RepID=A0A286RFP9_9BACT|nr:hypothetical protein THTE_2181 [Thermogutta terrifontis]